MEIREGGLDEPAVIALLDEHARGMLANSPPGSCHFLDHSALKAPEITFWSAWDGTILLGCGALKALEPGHGEIKSMRTTADQLRRGVGAALLEHILQAACGRGYTRLSLETGSGAAFEPALALYRRFGFTESGPFADYRPSDFSRYLTKPL